MKNVYLTRCKSFCAAHSRAELCRLRPSRRQSIVPASILCPSSAGRGHIGDQAVKQEETRLVTAHNEDEYQSELPEARQ